MNALSESLVENSKSAMIACVELHNKPVFPYRYEICVILAINSWELILKAFINVNMPEVKLLRKDGTTKPFEECLEIVTSKLGKDFRVQQENLSNLYEFRCNIIHFYKDHVGTIIYSLLHKNVIFYNEFLKKFFNIDLAEETNLVLLPIGFKPFSGPIDFLSANSDVKESSTAIESFVKSILTSTEKLNSEGIEDSIFTVYNMSVINEKRVKNADIITAITKNPDESALKVSTVHEVVQISDDEDAKKVKIEEETLFKTIYTLSFYDVTNQSRQLYSDFKQNAKFNKIMSGIKGNPNLHRKRFLDPNSTAGMGKDYYSLKIFEELANHYTKK
ncbi:MAG: DUF3644 domain-containing protein [Reichenbachiella sp.]|uniref:DUF3644 domain-containing protein n=1 Tax=Reichenbachiella sp. TaxID=2184521 RepID=UPI003266ED48